MPELLWELIEKSKDNNEYLKSETQYHNLESILSSYDKNTVEEVSEDWARKASEITSSEEFNKLHIMDGGIVNSGDDGFYMDFGSWIIAQGKDLFNEFKQNGHIAILKYIDKYKIPEEDYMFECMSYAFHKFI